MLAFLLRRLGQGLFVVVVMATLVFLGVYALGNPIDILISPEADQIEREQAIARLGLDQPIWVQFALFVKSALTGNWHLVRARRAGDRPHSRPHAGDPRACLRRARPLGRDRHSGRPAGRPQAALARRTRHHGRLDPGLLGAEFLARPNADPPVRRRAQAAAGRRARRDARRPRHRVVAADAATGCVT